MVDYIYKANELLGVTEMDAIATECAYCGEPLTDEEVANPIEHEAKDLICDDCYHENYEFACCDCCGFVVWSTCRGGK